MKKIMSIKKILTWIIVLVTIDILIKIIICNYFNERIDIIPGLLEFYPHFNNKFSFLNDTLYNDTGLNVGLIPHIIFFVGMQLIIMYIFRYFRRRNKSSVYLEWGFILFQAAYIAALVGWFSSNGILDYIYLKPLFIFDLKDLYIFGATCLLLIHSFKSLTKRANDKN